LARCRLCHGESCPMARSNGKAQTATGMPAKSGPCWRVRRSIRPYRPRSHVGTLQQRPT
jgi:hypothetical protein